VLERKEILFDNAFRCKKLPMLTQSMRLDNIFMRAGAASLIDHALTVMLSPNQNPSVWHYFSQRPSQFKAVHARHANVHHCNIGAESSHFFQI